EGGRALVPYFTAGDPSLEVTRALIEEAAARGADVIEVGLPFSDPLAAAPTIQRPGAPPLAGGVSLAKLLPLPAGPRRPIPAPPCLRPYLTRRYRYGLEAVTRDLADAGVAGLIVPDLPLEESAPLGQAARTADLELVGMAAPTSGPARLRRVARQSRGFVYLV